MSLTAARVLSPFPALRGCAAALGAALLASSAPAIAAVAYPLKLSPNGHSLVDQNGAPFRIHGDAAWSFIANLTAAEQETYLADRQAKGFNSILVNLLEHKFAVSAPQNRDGNYPFTSHTAGSYDFGTRNEVYFAFADQAISKAASHGIAVFLDPMYLGNSGGDEGWWSELTNGVNTKTVCYEYGKALGSRYGSYPNIVWVMGGDFSPPSPSEGEARLQMILTGLKAGGATQLVTGHWTSNTIATDQTNFASSLDLEATYLDPPQYKRSLPAYDAGPPVRPVFLLETGYEYEQWHPGDRASIRMYEQQSFLGGNLAGVFFGTADIWEFSTSSWNADYGFSKGPWQNSLNSPGSMDMARFGALLDALPWWKLVPSGRGGMKTLITSGGGSNGNLNWVTAAADPGGTLLLAYLPPSHSGSITVDVTVMSAPARARWWDPASGAFTAPVTVTTTAPQAFAPPGSNSSGAADWTLVIDTGTGTTVPDGGSAIPDAGTDPARTGPSCGCRGTTAGAALPAAAVFALWLRRRRRSRARDRI